MPTECPKLDDIILPSTERSSDTDSTDVDPYHDKYDYTIPFRHTRRALSNKPISSPAQSTVRSDITSTKGSDFQSTKHSVASPSTKQSLISPSTKPGLLTPTQVETPGSKTASKPSSNITTPKLVGGVKVLPTAPKPLNKTDQSKTVTPQSTSKSLTSNTVSLAKPRTPQLHSKPSAISPLAINSTPGKSAELKSEMDSVMKPKRGIQKARSPYPQSVSKSNPPSSTRPHSQRPIQECHITVDDRPNIPLKARIINDAKSSKWLNHCPPQNLHEGKRQFK